MPKDAGTVPRAALGCPGWAGEGAEAHGSQERPGVAGQAGVRVGPALLQPVSS